MNFFSQDNKVVQILSRIGDLMILNFFALVCSIPVITCGASLSALYAVTLKMVREHNVKGIIGRR